ncbi:MAG TPA: prepilin-type N-terminal cleavage/methylation domain-containing protein [Verrucomicrobiae bacterium]|nr:prepilin-type N-terminal cleavage/methylation domain-containing protein [Verrucomicrobiae bacterium]
MSINLRKSQAAFTLIETMISATLFAITLGIVLTVYLYSSRTFAILANYAQLDQNNRTALDTMTRELRSAQIVVTNTQNSITFINKDGQSVQYAFSPLTHELMKSVNGAPGTVLLTNCSLLNFNLGIRVPTNFDFYPWPSNEPSSEVKAVQLSWKAQSQVSGIANSVSEDVQTAKIVIRAAGTGAQ